MRLTRPVAAIRSVDVIFAADVVGRSAMGSGSARLAIGMAHG